MKKNSSLYNDEIDLFAIMKNIWEGKLQLILITVFSVLIGFVYNQTLPNNFRYSLIIKPNINSEFLEVDYLYKLLKKDDLSINKSPQNLSKINEIILDRFINEILDYDELTILLKENKKIKKDISKLSLNEQKQKLFNYAKSLQVEKTKTGQGEYTLFFA